MKDRLNIMKNKSFLSITLSLALSFLTFSCSSNLDSNLELTQNDFIAQYTNVKKAIWNHNKEKKYVNVLLYIEK